MVKKLGIVFTLCCVITTLLVACSSGSPTASTSGSQVQMNDTNFVQSSITIKKGESVTLVDNSLIAHTIANGTWKNGSPQQAQEPGAPAANNVQIGGNSSASIGPFNTSGSFNFYCTVHPGMNLTVIVQ